MINSNFNLSKAIQALIGRSPIPGRHHCNICNHRLSRYIPFSLEKAHRVTLPMVLDSIGSDLINFECPWCGAHDRERHLVLYMTDFGLLKNLEKKKILHFAPEKHLSQIISSCNPKQYIKGDLFPKQPDVECLNMLNLPFQEGIFDLVIANHVLEHVSDDLIALNEIHRIIKPGGYAVLQTPYSPLLHRTFSDKGIKTLKARLIAFGQNDHVRIYGRDIFTRFSSCGFHADIKQHKDIFSQLDAKILGVNENEPFFLFKR